jgi:hypothetical protein
MPRLSPAAAAFLLAVALSEGVAAATTTATLTVNASQAVRTVDGRILGLNTAIWDNDSTELGYPYVVGLLQATYVGAMRYPGGSTSDTFHWQTNSVESALPNTNLPDPTNISSDASWGTTFDDFAALALGLGAQPFITVNYGSGTPAEAAAWVEYSNVTKGYGFKYWEVGNECYGTWEMDGNVPAYDPVEYATRFAQYYTMMKAVDPTIKLGVPSIPSEDGNSASADPGVTNPRTKTVHFGWTPEVLNTLKTLGVTPDFLIFHYYPINDLPDENDANLLQASSAGVETENPMLPVSTYAAELRQELSDYLPDTGANVELDCTETNNEAGPPLGRQSTSLVDGLFMADTVGSYLQTEFNAMVWWDSFNGQSGPSDGGNFSSSVYGWRNVGDEGILYAGGGTYPTYYVFKLLGHLCHGGDTVIKASSTSTILSVYSVLRRDNSLSVMVINKDPAKTWTGNFAISGFLVPSTATAYSYGMPQDNAANPASSTYGIASTDLAQSTVSGVSSSFSTTFAPYSVTVLSLAPPLPVITTQPMGQTVNTGSTLVLTAAATSAASYQWYFDGNPVADSASGAATDLVTGATGPQLEISNTTIASAGSYTVVAANSAGSTPASSTAIVSVVSSQAPGAVSSISSRAYVGTGDNILIGGFYIVGSTSATVLVQAIGPALAAAPYSVLGTLQHPSLSIHQNQNGEDVVLYTNTGWGSSSVLLAAASAAYAFPTLQPGSADSELLVTLPPGGYTAEVSGVNNGTGVALCGIYQIP